MTGKHTPGPWELKTQRNCVDEYDCYLFPQRLYIPEGVSEADAGLLAAAPDLLEALIAAEQAFADSGVPMACHASLSQIRAAVAKATGAPCDPS